MHEHNGLAQKVVRTLGGLASSMLADRSGLWVQIPHDAGVAGSNPAIIYLIIYLSCKSKVRKKWSNGLLPAVVVQKHGTALGTLPCPASNPSGGVV